MTARTGMANIITKLRGMVEAGTADYTVASSAYWTDDQLQQVLDDNRVNIYNAPIVSGGTIGTSGTYEYKVYETGVHYWESDPVIQDDTWAAVGTANYSFDWLRGEVTFTADQSGKTRYISGKTYNINAAAAVVWNQKAAHYAMSYDFDTDNHSMKRSQIIQHCRQMAQAYGMAASNGSIYMERGDNIPNRHDYDRDDD